ncbi:DUF4097 family beta strand repeat protein [candidate division WOR-3 bacterium]|nr:DUF4097 family beta strand repeat protein [candidate division WOR-3 bacterium]
MKKRLRSQLLAVLFVLFAITPLSARGSYKYQREFRKTLEVKKGMDLSVSTRNGKIDIEKWDKDQVEIFAVVGTNKSEEELDKIDIDISVDENIVIETKFPADESKEKSSEEEKFSSWDLIKQAITSGFSGSGAVNYEIKVPNYLVVTEATSTNGEITLTGTKGPSKITTTNGEIKIENVEGNIEARTTNGKVEIENAKGLITATTTNGRIRVKGEGIKELRTTNGGIEAEFKGIEEGGSEISTTNGSITIGIPGSLNSVLELSTTNGGIDLDDISLEVISQHKNKYIKGIMGQGGPEINASTTNGSIKIRKL